MEEGVEEEMGKSKPREDRKYLDRGAHIVKNSSHCTLMI